MLRLNITEYPQIGDCEIEIFECATCGEAWAEGMCVGCIGEVVEMRGGGGGGGGGSGGLNPRKCASKRANFRNLKANVQILDRKTPPPKWFTLFRLLYRCVCVGGGGTAPMPYELSLSWPSGGSRGGGSRGSGPPFCATM